MNIRWMIRADLSQVLNIEERAFEFPWTKDEFIRRLRLRYCIAMVIESIRRQPEQSAAGRRPIQDHAGVLQHDWYARYSCIYGYCVYELWPRRLTLTNFAVDPEHQLQGIGSELMAKMIGKLALKGKRQCIRFDIRETNLAGQLFLRHCGFVVTDIMRDFYELSELSDEQAYRFEFRVHPEMDGPAAAARLLERKVQV